MESVLTTVKRGRIAIFTLNRPEKYNALNPALIQALEEAMLDFMEDHTKRTPKMKLQQAFILEVQMINNLCFDANL